MKATELIWHNGEIKPWQEATVHVMAHGLHYGSSVFEGIRVYDTPAGSAAFRLRDHIERMGDSARIYHMDLPYDAETLSRACREIVHVNGLSSAYVRPIAYRGLGTLAVAAGAETPVEVAIAAIEWGAYLGEEARRNGVDVCVSSWQRAAPNTIPTMAKAGGNYLSGQLVAMEAQRLGFAEGISLASDGTLSEGSGENLFLVRDSVLYTPPVTASILAGITRDSVIQLARERDLQVVEQSLPREMLYLADEIFFTGTAVEITAVRSVDGVVVRCGGRGPVTRRLEDAFFGLFDGTTKDRHGWLEPVAKDTARDPAHA